MGKTFEPEVVAQIARHMNEDHADHNVLIVRTLGGQPDATAARMSGLDDEAMEFEATVHDIAVPVRIPFSAPVTDRHQVRAEAARMVNQARAALGEAPEA